MADLTNFNMELAALDPARAFSFTLDPIYGANEWSVDGYHVRAGSDAAVAHGASEALYRLGYRFWTPQKTTRPDSLPPEGVTLPRQSFRYPHVRMFFNYGFGSGTAIRNRLGAEYATWANLVCFDDDRRPVGHAYPAIINAINAEDGFFIDNPGYVYGTGSSQTFALDIGEPGLGAIKERVAAHLAANLNAYNRASIDPQDGSTWSSEQVFGFANDVVALVRQQVPDAMLGLYGYAGHRQPVTFPCPHLYVDLARGFNDLGIGYLAIGKLWAQVVPEFGLRCYGDIAAWQGWSRHIPATYLADFAEHHADGAVGISMETSANWTKNVIAKQHWQRHWRDGVTTYDDVLSDAVDRLYGGDARVGELFSYWSGQENVPGSYGLERAARIVSAMPDTDYRAEFERYLTFAMQDNRLHSRVTAHTPQYFSGLERNMRATAAQEASGEIHHYAYIRQRANANTTQNGRPDLSFNANPHWGRHPEPYMRADFDVLRAEVQRLTARPIALEDKRLVLVDTTPWPGAAVSEAKGFVTLGLVTFVFAGPGTVTVRYASAAKTDENLSFGKGLHQFTIGAGATTTWSSGMLFLSLFPEARLDPMFENDSNYLNRWMYVPAVSKGKVTLSSGVRIRVYDRTSQFNVKQARPPFSTGMDDPRFIEPGIVRVDNVNTRGTHSSGNINPFVSPTPYTMLMPFDLAVREFPGIVFSGSGAVPTVVDLSDDTEGFSDQTEE